MKNIILIGFMGSGKTTAGKLLAEKLSMHFIDTDDLIEQIAQKKISDIFKENGEAHFRDMESKIIDTLSGYDKFVIATGGGIVLRPENVTKLKAIGQLVLLSAKPDVIYDRVKGNKDRPLLHADPMAKIKDILGKRNPIYRAAADIEVDTSKLSVAQVVDMIMSLDIMP